MSCAGLLVYVWAFEVGGWGLGWRWREGVSLLLICWLEEMECIVSSE